MSTNLRGRLENELLTDADFTAFCLDSFPEIEKRFSQGMERRQKVNLLLQLADTNVIEAKLAAWLASHRSAAGSAQPRSGGPERALPGPRRYGLAPLPSPLVAREEYVAVITALCANGNTPLPFVLLTGGPGMGKSTLAACVARARQVEETFTDGVYCLRVQSRTADDLIAELAHALGEESRAPSQRLLERITEVVRGRRILLILDDIREPALLSELSLLLAEVAILATTRHRHDTSSITVVVEIDKLPDSQARELVSKTLMDRWRRHVDSSWVSWLCERLGNHALALSLAANSMGRLRLSEKAFIRRLEREFFSALEGNTADRSLQATLQLSWQGLSLLQKDVIVAIGQLAEAPIWEELLQFLIRKDLREGMDRLVEVSLIYRINDEQFSVHPVIYQWCKAQGKGDINIDTLQLRLTAWLINGYKKRGPESIRPGVIAHLLRAQEWAQQTKRWNWVSDLVIIWEPALDGTGYWKELAHMWSCAVETKRHGFPKRDLAIALHNYGVTLHKMGGLQEAQACYEESGALFRAEGMPGELGRSVLECGILAEELGKYDEARARYDECLEMFQKSADEEGVAKALYHQGKIALIYNDYSTATSLIEKSLSLSQKENRYSEISKCLNVLGNIKTASDPIEAERLLLDSAAYAQSAGNISDKAKSLHGLGIIFYQTERIEEAKKNFLESLALKRQIGDRLGAASTLYMLGMLAERDGDDEKARTAYQESLEKMNAANVQTPDRGRVLYGLARIAYKFGDILNARTLATESMSYLVKLHDPLSVKVHEFLQSLS